MTDGTGLDEIDIVKRDEYPPSASVKLNGPPGTGKTTQCAARLAEMIREGRVEIGDVTWVTYRRSLALDTLKRLVAWDIIDERELDNPRRGATANIGTIHAIANSVGASERMNMSRQDGGNMDVATESDKRDFCDDKNIRYSSGTEWEKGPGQLFFGIESYLANNLMEPPEADEAPQYAEYQQKYTGMATFEKLHEDWITYKDDNNLYDFHEMLDHAYHADELPPTEVVIIDEYHDTTPAMDRLSQKWLDAAETAIVAGDPLQVVNAYQGASPEFYEQIDLDEILLPKSWRVPEKHWDIATETLTNAHEAPPIEIGDSEGRINEITTDGRYEYNEYSQEWATPTKNGAAELVDRYGRDIMFLTRTKMQGYGLMQELKRAGVLYRAQQGLGGWQHANKRRELYNVLQKIQNLSAADFGGARGLGDFNGEDAKSPDRVGLTSDEAARILDHAKATTLSQSRGETDKIVGELRDQDASLLATDLDDHVKEDFWRIYTQGPSAVNSLIGMKDDSAKILRRALERNEKPIDSTTVLPYVMTIHASKGSEAETVVLYDGVTDNIHEGMHREPETRQNEWRTWYVAQTRARKNLVIVRGAFDWTHSILPRAVEA